jgi:hypothetical protein
LSGIERAFACHPAAIAVAGPCRFVAAPWWGNPYSTVLFGLVGVIKKTTGRVFYISATNIAFRKCAWSGYDTRLTQGGDELDLLRRLQAVGEVVFDSTNPTHTSSRRLDQGLLYNITVTVMYYYLLGYALNRMFGRRVLGTAPPFRGTLDHARSSARPPARLSRLTSGTWLLTTWRRR